MAAGGSAQKEKERRRPGLRIEVTGAGGILVLGGAVIAAGFGAAWAAHRAHAKNRSKQTDAGERGRRDEGEKRSGSGLRSLLPPRETPSAPSLSYTEIGELSHEELSVKPKGMGTQENGFISEVKQNSEICMATEENHLDASIHGDDMKHSLLEGNESNMPEYSKLPIAEGLMSFDVKEAVEESEGGEEIEETPSVESQEEGTEFSVEEEGEKGEEGSDETTASSVQLSVEAKWMGTQENGFISEIKQNSEICMAAEQNHLEARIHGDDMKHSLLDGDESNMPEYSKEPIAEGLISFDVKEAVEESEGGEEIEGTPSVESQEEGTESSVEEKGEKGEEGSDETTSSSVHLSIKAKWMGTQENGFISEVKENSKICMATEENHLEASIHGDDMKHSLLDGNVSNMPEYSKQPFAEGLMSFDIKEAVEESEGGEEIEETPSVESQEEGTESSIEEEGEKVEEGADETAASSVQLPIEAKWMGTQENEFICEIKQNSKICMATKENHLEASIHGDDTKHFSLDGDESNMPAYSKEPIADGLMSIDVKEAAEESECGEEIEEAPSVESEEEGTESSIDVEGDKGEEGSDETVASSVESNTEAIWPAETFEMEESLPPLELIQVKNNLEIIEETKDIVNAARSTEEEIVKECEEKGLILDEGEAIAAGNMKTIRLPTTMFMEKEMDITPISHSKVFLLLLVLALSIGLLSFMHHHHLYALYQQFCRFFFVVNNDDL